VKAPRIGRPPIAKKDRKATLLFVRLTQAERTIVEHAADNAGVGSPSRRGVHSSPRPFAINRSAMPCVASSIATPFRFSRSHVVTRVVYEPGTLAVHVTGAPDDPSVVVAFERVKAIRVTDEGNMMAFWPTCSRPNGWLFEVHEGGWLADEIARPGILVMNRGLREFLVTGEYDCVNILSLSPPTVTAERPGS
jgi:hypothetical protein